MLYITNGRWRINDDPFNNGQRTRNSLLGKILRIDVNKRDGYGIRKNNPWVGKSGRPEVWAVGNAQTRGVSASIARTGDL